MGVLTLENIVRSNKISSYVTTLSPPLINKLCLGEERKHLVIFPDNILPPATLQQFVHQVFRDSNVRFCYCQHFLTSHILLLQAFSAKRKILLCKCRKEEPKHRRKGFWPCLYSVLIKTSFHFSHSAKVLIIFTH